MALIDKASLLMVPSTYEAGTLYNVLPSGNRAPDSTDQNSGYDQTRADFTFDRGSNAAATRIGSDGLIKKYRENLLVQSNQFDTTWQEVNAGAQSSSIEDIDGGTNAWLLRETAVTGAHYIRQSSGITSGVGTFSFYAKKKDYDWVQFSQSGDGGNYANFNIANGTLGNANSSFFIDRKIEAVGATGWYRCSVTYTFGSGAYVGVSLIRSDVSTRYDSYSGDVTKGTYIQNAQLETGLVATDYLDSGATTAKAGVLIDLPRINYDANGENGALLLEPQRTNIFAQSEYYTGGDYDLNTGTTLTNNYATSPEGVKNATRYLGTGTSGFGDKFTLINGTSYTISAYVKSNTGVTQYCRLIGDSSNISSDLEITTEWTRIQYTWTSGGLTSKTSGIFRDSSNNDIDILVYGLQLEAGSYATSYIPNHGTSGGVTRAADSCSVTGVSDVIGQTEGTLFAEFYGYENTGSEGNRIIAIGDGTSSKRVMILDSNTNIRFLISNSGTQVDYNSSVSAEGIHKVAIAYANNDVAMYIDGVQVSTDTSASIPACSNIYVGTREDGNITPLSGGIKQAIVFNEALSDAECVTLTTL